jgi:hypothetical protein
LNGIDTVALESMKPPPPRSTINPDSDKKRAVRPMATRTESTKHPPRCNEDGYLDKVPMVRPKQEEHRRHVPEVMEINDITEENVKSEIVFSTNVEFSR